MPKSIREAVLAAALACAAVLAAPAARAEEFDWRPVMESGDVELWYDAAMTLARDGLTRVIIRTEHVRPQTAPGESGRYVTLGETLMLDCAARTYTSVERTYYDTAGAEVFTTAAPEGPAPFEDGLGVARISDMVC